MEGFAYEADPQITRLVDDFVKENWDGIDERRDVQASPYTMTKDGYFVLHKLPGRPEVCIFTGGNGRAFKFAPLIGRCLAELVLDLQPSYDLAPLSAARKALLREQAAPAPAPASTCSSSVDSTDGSTTCSSDTVHGHANGSAYAKGNASSANGSAGMNGNSSTNGRSGISTVSSQESNNGGSSAADVTGAKVSNKP